MELDRLIETRIRELVAGAGTVTVYREPLVGFASTDNHLFQEMSEGQTTGVRHLHPKELLPDASTVVAFFLPFGSGVVNANREGSQVAREWALAYIETNQLISTICNHLAKELAEAGVKTAFEPATHNFSRETLTAAWSHKSVAYVAGLGTFGVNQMLITGAGCAGRFGSMVISAEIPADDPVSEELCRNRQGRSCLYCVRNCPAGALTREGLNRERCYQQVMEVNEAFSDLPLCDVCGKCATGPCAVLTRRA